MFDQVKKTGADLNILGAEMAARKDRLVAEYEANGLPKPEVHTLAQVEAATPATTPTARAARPESPWKAPAARLAGALPASASPAPCPERTVAHRGEPL